MSWMGECLHAWVRGEEFKWEWIHKERVALFECTTA